MVRFDQQVDILIETPLHTVIDVNQIFALVGPQNLSPARYRSISLTRCHYGFKKTHLSTDFPFDHIVTAKPRI